MLRKRLISGHPVQPFVDLNTLKGMAEVAKNIGQARQLVQDIQYSEDNMVKRRLDEKGMNHQMQRIKDSSRMAGECADDAIALLRSMQWDVERYVKGMKEQ